MGIVRRWRSLDSHVSLTCPFRLRVAAFLLPQVLSSSRRKVNCERMAAAGVFTGLQCFIDSIMYASNVFAGSPDLAIAIQSSLVGYALMQLVVTYFSGVRVLIAPVSYEVIPFLVSLSVIVRAAVPAAAVTPTMLAASCVVNGLAAVLLGLVSFLP